MVEFYDWNHKANYFLQIKVDVYLRFKFYANNNLEI